MRTTGLWKAFGAVVVGSLLAAQPVFARDLTVVSWGGNYQDAQKKIYFEPFAKETGKPLPAKRLGAIALRIAPWRRTTPGRAQRPTSAVRAPVDGARVRPRW